jgi:endonuclease YncB( thermonuclease family)
MKSYQFLAIAAVFCTVGTGNAFAEKLPTAECVYKDWKGVKSMRGKVLRVVDGDTVRVAFNGKDYSVRLEGIDTPETNYQGKSQGFWAEKAKAHLKRILSAETAVVVQFPESPCDKYGRLLGYVFDGDECINARMVEDAFAVNYCIYPQKGCKQLADLTRVNVKQQRGIYSGDPKVEIPYEWRRQVSKRPHEKYIGNLFTHKVYKPGSLSKVPVSDRVFFMKKTDIKEPYHLVD